MSIIFEINSCEEQSSDFTTIDSSKKQKSSKAEYSIVSNSFSVSSSNNYFSLYKEKVQALLDLEREFNQMHDSVSKLLTNAK